MEHFVEYYQPSIPGILMASLYKIRLYKPNTQDLQIRKTVDNR